MHHLLGAEHGERLPARVKVATPAERDHLLGEGLDGLRLRLGRPDPAVLDERARQVGVQRLAVRRIAAELLPCASVTHTRALLGEPAGAVLTAQVEAVLPALQKQVSDDFKAYWDLDCTLAFLANGQPLTHGYWQIVIIDNPDQAGALGYHEMTSAGTPLGKVFAKLDLESGSSWTATPSHELLEMLADPWINWCAMGSDSRIYALEVCDAVEDDRLGYKIDGVLVSDFITPAWFEPTDADRLDFKRHLSKQLELARGGYISIFDRSNGWTQITAKGEGGPRMAPGSRRQRRKLIRPAWRTSLR